MVQGNAALTIENFWEKPAANDESVSGPVYYYRARYYDPEIGRFPQEDPIGFAGGINFYAYCNNNPINCNDPMGKLGGPFSFLNTRGALSNPDFAGASNFTNAVGVTGTGVAALPFVAADTVGLSAITAPAEATAGAFARTALISGTIGGTTAGLGTVVTGGDARDVVINTGVGFGLGAVAPAFEVSGFLANAGKGAVLGGSGSTISQFIDIGTDPSKTINDFNVGTVLGSAVGGGLTSGLTAPFGSSLGERISAGIFSFGPATAASAIGERLGAPSASGGFVLYPSKPNTNQLRAVYQK